MNSTEIEDRNGFVSIIELARELGVDRSTAHKIVRKSGVQALRRRSAEARGASFVVVSRADATRIVRGRLDMGFARPDGDSLDIDPDVIESGSFYVIQLIPDLLPTRVKLGFATDPDRRLAQHRTAAPTATVHRTWPAKRAWELTAIASMTRVGCVSLSNEAFDCDSLEALCERADQFFALLP